MKTPRSGRCLLAVAASFAGSFLPLRADPPASPAPTVQPVASPTPETPPEPSGLLPLPRLLDATGPGSDDVVPLRTLVETAAGVHVVPMDRKNPKDAAVIKRLGDAMNAVLPRMNQPKSEALTTVDGVRRNTVFALALAEQFKTAKNLEPDAAQIGGGTLGSGPFSSLWGGNADDDFYPTFTAVYPGGDRAYCVSVVFFDPANRSHFDRAPRIHPRALGALREKLGRETSCLLIAVETTGGNSPSARFLNWEILDAGEMPVRAELSFTGTELPRLKSRLDDGRKGTD